MSIDYRRLRAVVCVADERSFSRAAAQLSISQPALSAQIQGFEKQLGFRVFDRSTRRVELTPSGERFLDEARRVVDESARLERFVGALRREALTQLVIGTPIYTIDFPDRVTYLESLVATCSDIRVEIMTALTQTEITIQLATGQLDMAIVMGVPISNVEYRRAVASGAGRESVFDKELRTVVLAQQPVALLVPANTPQARRRKVRPQDLAGQRVAIPHEYHGQALYQPIAQFLHDAGAEPVLPPEPNAIGVERYGRQFQIPAITLGWFPQPAKSGMVRRPLEQLDLHTQLALVGHPELSTPSIERAYALALHLVRAGAAAP